MRRKIPTPHELTELAAKVPPWFTLPGALASFFGFRWLASHQHVPKTISANQVGDALTTEIILVASILAEYTLPYIFLMATAMWLYKKHKLLKILNMANKAADTGFTKLAPTEFEDVVAAGFSSHGFQVQRTSEGADGGVDLIMTREGHRFLVQCKHYQSTSISVDLVRSFYGAMQHFKADAGYFVTSGQFTKPASDFAEGKSLWLYNGDKLQDLLIRGRDAAHPDGRLILDRAAREPIGTPDCPLCRSSTILRTAKQGPRSGKRFFGCSTYPACSGTIDVD